MSNNRLSYKLFEVIFFLVIFFALTKFSSQLNPVEGYECNNGPRNSDSGGCGTPCYAGDSWTKYDKKVSCYQSSGGYVWIPGTNFCLRKLTYVCSTADKCLNEVTLRWGNCNCSVGNPYKICCVGSTAVTCRQINVDGRYPPEGVCPSGSTTVYGTSCPNPQPNCGTKCGQNGCNACACNNDYRNPAYNWSNLGSSSDCSSCWCGRTPPCSCSGWTNQSCGAGGCSALQRLQTRTCNPSGCSSTSQCVNDSSCCQCTGWVNGACGAAGSCPVGQRRQTRTCNPSGCSSTSQCVNDAACACNFSAWTDVGCGEGGCALNRMYQTRTAAFPECSPLTQCAATASCASSCTVSLTPSPLTAGFGQSTILTASVNPLHATVSKVDFSSDNPTIASVDPASDGDDPYRTYVYGNQMGEAVVTATATLSPEGSCQATVPVTVRSAAWFQTQGGDIHAQGSLTDKIPSTADDPNLSLELNNYPGVVSYDPSGQVDLGEGFSSGDTAGNWVASSKYQGKPYATFDFFKKKYAMEMTSDNFNGSLSGTDGVYYSSGGETLNSDQGDWDLSGNRWLVILVEGDVNVPFNVVVGQGSFLAIASSGKITFGNNVRKAQGMFVANGTIDTGTTDRDFEGQGVFAASGFGLNRDFGDERNETTPVETFVARPDFLMSSYKSKDENLWWFFQKWQELAP